MRLWERPTVRQRSLKRTKIFKLLQQATHKPRVTGRQRKLTPRQMFSKEFLQVLVKNQTKTKQNTARSTSKAQGKVRPNLAPADSHAGLAYSHQMRACSENGRKMKLEVDGFSHSTHDAKTHGDKLKTSQKCSEEIRNLELLTEKKHS